jgi:hypothetical protein
LLARTSTTFTMDPSRSAGDIPEKIDFFSLPTLNPFAASPSESPSLAFYYPLLQPRAGQGFGAIFGNYTRQPLRFAPIVFRKRRVLRIPRGLETFQPPGAGADTCPIWTPNPARCCIGAKICRSEQKNCVILAKKYFYLNLAGCCNGAKIYRSKQNICVIVAKNSFHLNPSNASMKHKKHLSFDSS